MRISHFLGAFVVGGLLINGSAFGAAVTSAGSQLGTGGDLTNATTGIDWDGDFMFYLDGASGQISQNPDFFLDSRNTLPSSLTIAAGADFSGVSGGWGYQTITTDFGSGESGVATSDPGGGDEILTLTANAAGSMTLGLVGDNTDGAGFSPASYTVSVNGSSDSQAAASIDLNSDLYVFEITGLLPGDVISVQVGNNGGFTTTLAGLLVTDIPEPASIALLGLGGLMMIRRRR